MSDARAAVDLDAEREVDLRSWWGRITDRWWLPAGGAVVGAVLGVLISVGGGEVYEAGTLLYLGQPFAPNGGGQIQSLQTNPRTVSEIVRSEAAIRRAAAAAGMRPGQLRGNVATQTIVAPGQGARSLSPLQQIKVQAPSRAKAEAASASLAASVVGAVSPYVAEKMRLLQRQIDDDNEALTTATRRIEAALEQQDALRTSNLPLGERFFIQAGINSTLQFYEARLVSLRIDKTNAEQLLSLAEKVEKSFVVEKGQAVETSAASARNAALVGVLIGLLLGALAAVVADPLLARRRAAASA